MAMALVGSASCPSCGYPQPANNYNREGSINCPQCSSRLHTDVFPALYQAPEGAVLGAEAALGAATCFYHPEKEAAVPCGTCGRYLCTLCDIEMGEDHICPACMDKAASEEEDPGLVASRTMYDSIALSLAIMPLIMWPFTFITAPMSIYFCIRYWRTPLSIMPRTRIRFVFAFLIAGLQVTAWTVFLATVIF
jgi:hypothetical protein